jgi:hypothetical protein
MLPGTARSRDRRFRATKAFDQQRDFRVRAIAAAVFRETCPIRILFTDDLNQCYPSRTATGMGNMAWMPSDADASNDGPRPVTVAELFVYLSDPVQRQELEEFRVEYEALNGPTDLTKHYTSMWPQPQRELLFQHHTKLWFDGLPPFAKAYLRGKMEIAAKDGRLDDAPDKLLKLFVAGEIRRGRTTGR